MNMNNNSNYDEENNRMNSASNRKKNSNRNNNTTHKSHNQNDNNSSTNSKKCEKTPMTVVANEAHTHNVKNNTP